MYTRMMLYKVERQNSSAVVVIEAMHPAVISFQLRNITYSIIQGFLNYSSFSF